MSMGCGSNWLIIASSSGIFLFLVLVLRMPGPFVYIFVSYTHHVYVKRFWTPVPLC